MRPILVALVLCLAACSSGESQDRQQPLDTQHQDQRCAEEVSPIKVPNGIVSTKRVAKIAAYQYLRTIFGDEIQLRHLRTSLNNGVWTITGTLPTNYVGGVPSIQMCQSNGRVLGLQHSK